MKTADETNRWVAQVLIKYGRYIRHLTVQWDVVLMATVNPWGGEDMNGVCTRLRTLVVGDIKEYLRERPSLPPGVKSPPMLPIPPFPPTSTTRTGAGMGVGAGVYKFSPPPPPLPFYMRSSIWISRRGIDNHGENIFHRILVGIFWNLVQRNPELTKITFPNIATMDDTASAFVFTNLRAVKNLKELDLTRTHLDMGNLLSSVPQLQRLKGYALTDIYSLEQKHAALRSLDLSPSCAQIHRLLCMMVRCLPGLEELRFKKVTRESSNHHISMMPECPAFPPLRRLFIDEVSELDDKDVALFVGRLPGLLQIQIPTVFAEMEKALWDSCVLLEEVHGDNAFSLDAWKERRAKSVSICGRTDNV
jgi:hypothetical protein